MPQDKQIAKSQDTPLFGETAKIDSLGFVNLLINIESNIEDEFNMSIIIANEQAMAQKNSPFKTIGTLTEYVGYLVKDIKGEDFKKVFSLKRFFLQDFGALKELHY